LASSAPDNIERLAQLADGAAYPAVRPEVVLVTDVPVAPDPVIRSFAQMTRPLLAKVAAAERESRILGSLRDGLLPKLVSGEIRVRQAEKIVGRVA